MTFVWPGFVIYFLYGLHHSQENKPLSSYSQIITYTEPGGGLTPAKLQERNPKTPPTTTTATSTPPTTMRVRHSKQRASQWDTVSNGRVSNRRGWEYTAGELQEQQNKTGDQEREHLQQDWWGSRTPGAKSNYEWRQPSSRYTRQRTRWNLIKELTA